MSLSALHFGDLANGQIALRTLDYTALSDRQVSYLRSLLSKEELKRNDSFSQERLRRRDIACRGLLRLQLSQLLGIPGMDIELKQNDNGKPLLNSLADTMHFNYSHSGDYAAFAFCRDTEIGVDIEYSMRRNNLSTLR